MELRIQDWNKPSGVVSYPMFSAQEDRRSRSDGCASMGLRCSPWCGERSSGVESYPSNEHGRHSGGRDARRKASGRVFHERYCVYLSEEVAEALRSHSRRSQRVLEMYSLL